MTSKISSFNIAKEDMRHRLWMLALSCLGSFLALPVTFLLAMRTYTEYVARSEAYTIDQIRQILQSEYIRFFNTESVITEGIILCAGAFIVAVFGFRFLYSRKMVDLFHSVPVKRSRIFLITYLNGLVIWLVPMLASMLITLVIAFVSLGSPFYFGAVAAAAGKITLVFLFCFLIVYHLCLLAVMVSGNAFNAICSALIMGTVITGIYGLVYSFCQAFLDTFIRLPVSLENISWTSPLVSVVIILIEAAHPGYFSNFLFLAVISALLSAGTLAAAWKLYLKRPSELAEGGIQNKWFQNILRLLGSLFLGFCGGALFVVILGSDNVLGWCLFGIILCTVFSFGVMNIVFHMNFKSFFAHKAQMAGITLAACLILLAISLDWTGYDTRIPSKDQIAGATISVGGYTDYSYDLTVSQDGTLIDEDGREYDYDMNYTDVDTIYSALSSMAANPSRDSDWVTYSYVNLRLKNGMSFCRRYPVTQDQADLIRPIVESEEYKNTFYKLSNGNLPLADSLSIDGVLKRATNYLEDKESIAAVMDAYKKDFSEHYRLEELRSGAVACRLSIHYESDHARYYYDLDVYSHYSNTLETIRSLFPDMVLTAQDLKIDSLRIRTDVGSEMPRESLYSYFGLDGYPDYDEYSEANRQGGAAAGDIASAEFGPERASVVRKDAYDESSGLYYGLSLSDAEDIAELLPYLYVGDEISAYYFSRGYVYAGEVVLEDGSAITCNVKLGVMPKEWIDKLKIVED